MGEYVPSPRQRVRAKPKPTLKYPVQYRVLLHNDHYTTMEFVVQVLRCVFRKDHDQAVSIMLNVHQKGIGVCGVYAHEIAETKVATVHKLAQDEGFPLKCSMEPE